MPPEFDIEKKHLLGKRAFALFLSKKLKVTIALLALTIAVWQSENFAPPEYIDAIDYALHLLALATVLYFILVFTQTYVEYRHYTYHFTNEAFIMTSGYLTFNEIAALYHQIQNVNIRRTALDRMLGVSQVVILMIGTEGDARRAHITLPGVGKTKAKLVQQELLSRARRHVTQKRESTPAP